MWLDSYNYVANNYDLIGHQHHIRLLKRGVLLDTAPLFVLVVGHYDKLNGTKFISKFQSKSKEKERRYQIYDYDYLLAFLNSCGLGKKYNLFITPHVFTEFIKHLWKYVDSPEHFKKILVEFFKNKWYIEERAIDCAKITEHEDFLKKRIEIGDISLTIICKDKGNPYMAVLTDDKNFARIADGEYGLLSIYYDDIRLGTIALNRKNIRKELLEEPTQEKTLI